jgi:predicted PurR-regulated permease PerM
MASPKRTPAAIIYRAILLAFGLLVLGLLFRELVTLMLAVLMTVIIAIPLSAGATRLERHGLPRPLGALLCLFSGLLVLAGILALVIPPFIDETKQFVDAVPGIWQSLQARIHDITGAKPEDIGHRVQDFLQRYVDKPERLIGPITSIGLNVAGVLAALVVMLMTAFFIAANPRPLIDGALSLVPPDRRPRALHVMRRLRIAWIGWMQGVLLHMLIEGILLYIALSIIGLEFAIVFAVLTALLIVVPYFGAIAGSIPPVLLALTHSPGKALLVMAVYVALQQIEGNVIIPLVMSRTVKLHPAVIAVGVVVVGEVFGFVGLFVSVPILSAAVILVDELWVKPTEEEYAQRDRGQLELAAEEGRAPPRAGAAGGG